MEALANDHRSHRIHASSPVCMDDAIANRIGPLNTLSDAIADRVLALNTRPILTDDTIRELLDRHTDEYSISHAALAQLTNRLWMTQGQPNTTEGEKDRQKQIVHQLVRQMNGGERVVEPTSNARRFYTPEQDYVLLAPFFGQDPEHTKSHIFTHYATPKNVVFVRNRSTRRLPDGRGSPETYLTSDSEDADRFI